MLFEVTRWLGDHLGLIPWWGGILLVGCLWLLQFKGERGARLSAIGWVGSALVVLCLVCLLGAVQGIQQWWRTWDLSLSERKVVGAYSWGVPSYTRSLLAVDRTLNLACSTVVVHPPTPGGGEELFNPYFRDKARYELYPRRVAALRGDLLERVSTVLAQERMSNPDCLLTFMIPPVVQVKAAEKILRLPSTPSVESSSAMLCRTDCERSQPEG